MTLIRQAHKAPPHCRLLHLTVCPPCHPQGCLPGLDSPLLWPGLAHHISRSAHVGAPQQLAADPCPLHIRHPERGSNSSCSGGGRGNPGAQAATQPRGRHKVRKDGAGFARFIAEGWLPAQAVIHGMLVFIFIPQAKRAACLSACDFACIFVYGHKDQKAPKRSGVNMHQQHQRQANACVAAINAVCCNGLCTRLLPHARPALSAPPGCVTAVRAHDGQELEFDRTFDRYVSWRMRQQQQQQDANGADGEPAPPPPRWHPSMVGGRVTGVEGVSVSGSQIIKLWS